MWEERGGILPRKELQKSLKNKNASVCGATFTCITLCEASSVIIKTGSCPPGGKRHRKALCCLASLQIYHCLKPRLPSLFAGFQFLLSLSQAQDEVAWVER